MAELVFFTGPMDSGKSTLALQMVYTQSAHDRKGRLFTKLDRCGNARISSRIGLAQDAIEVDDDLDFWQYLVSTLSTGISLDYLVCDETQFYTGKQIEQLAKIVDELGIDVFCFGILSDFRTQLFPGSKRLVELADSIQHTPITPLCWCGSPATMNARTVNGVMVTEGDQVCIGDTNASESVVSYEVLCRRHHRLMMTKHNTQATLSPDTLPFDD